MTAVIKSVCSNPVISSDIPGKTLMYIQDRRGVHSKPNVAIYSELIKKLEKILESKISRPGVYSASQLQAAGLHYTGTGDKAVCNKCHFEKEHWSIDQDPFTLHKQTCPDCPFVVEKLSSFKINIKPSNHEASSCCYVSSHPYKQNTTDGGIQESEITQNDGPNKRQKLENKQHESQLVTLFETQSLKNCRKRSFIGWPHRSMANSEQMIEAGFFNCNVGDRVICIYCNLICQQWSSDSDSDPWLVHRTLSPKCIFVKSKSSHLDNVTLPIVNENPSDRINSDIPNVGIVHAVAAAPAYADLPRREATFRTWISQNSPPVEKLVKAGFFYSGTSNIVTCFYCNGSLQNWGPNDDPTVEHARWFPNCAYARQLCGDELYKKIQFSKQVQKERTAAQGNNNQDRAMRSGMPNMGQLPIPDESTLTRFVAARLDLPVSQDLLGKNFKLSIIKRCWEDQLRIKRDDFQHDVDLYMACTILKKQIEYIDGKRDKIVIPSIKMRQLREESVRENQARIRQQNQIVEDQTTAMNTEAPSASASATESVEKASTSDQKSNTQEQPKLSNSTDGGSADEPNPNNPCVICLQEEKGLACIPCGHLVACVPCGHSLRTCPICRRDIQAFVRIYT